MPLDLAKFPDLTEAQRDEIIMEGVRNAGHILLLTFQLAKVPNYIVGGFQDGDGQPWEVKFGRKGFTTPTPPGVVPVEGLENLLRRAAVAHEGPYAVEILGNRTRWFKTNGGSNILRQLDSEFELGQLKAEPAQRLRATDAYMAAADPQTIASLIREVLFYRATPAPVPALLAQLAAEARAAGAGWVAVGDRLPEPGREVIVRHLEQPDPRKSECMVATLVHNHPHAEGAGFLDNYNNVWIAARFLEWMYLPGGRTVQLDPAT